MIINNSLRHLKISLGDQNLFLSFVKYCILHRKKSYCIPIHVTKYEMSKLDYKLKGVINAADIVLADGVPIVWLSRWLRYKEVFKVTGIDFAEAILAQSKKQNWNIFLLGASPENLEKALHNISKKFENPQIVGAHHGYFNNGTIEKVINNINELKPDILLLGLSMPQKEYFIYDYFNKAEATFWLPVGGAFDIWAKAKKRAPSPIQKLGLEWLYRSIYDRSKVMNILKYSFAFSKDFLFN